MENYLNVCIEIYTCDCVVEWAGGGVHIPSNPCEKTKWIVLKTTKERLVK